MIKLNRKITRYKAPKPSRKKARARKPPPDPSDSNTRDTVLSDTLDSSPSPLPDTDKTTSSPGFAYRETSRGLIWLKPSLDGPPVEIDLCNFTARIISETEEDDGLEIKRTSEITVRKGNREKTSRIATEKFFALNWPAQALGLSAIILPGQTIREHIRCAVQLLSQGAPQRKLYTHLGWRKIENQWVYLHSKGAIGSQGSLPNIDVAPPASLALYALPDPPTGEELREAIRASLKLLSVAPLRVTAPVYASVWRAVLGWSPYTTHLEGKSGGKKTGVALLALAHHGAGFTYKTIPAFWLWSAGSIEDLAFSAKDCLLLVDDFKPGGSAAEIARRHGEAQRVINSQGDGSGRGRLTSSITQRPVKPPRGLLLSTGEEIPGGLSLRARMNIVEVKPEDVNKERLTSCQADAASGLYSLAMAGFLSWVAPQYDEIRERLELNTLEWRKFVPASHDRTADNIASLAAGVERFLTFALLCEALSPQEMTTLWSNIWQALLASSSTQATLQADSDPAKRFIELITSALSSGRCHLTSPIGLEPPDYPLWGWDASGPGGDVKPHGEKIGWVDEGNVYLDPEASHAIAQRLATDLHEPLPVTAQVLRKRLNENGYLITEPSQETVMVRRILERKMHRVLNFKKSLFVDGLFPQATSILEPETSQSPNDTQNGEGKLLN